MSGKKYDSGAQKRKKAALNIAASDPKQLRLSFLSGNDKGKNDLDVSSEEADTCRSVQKSTGPEVLDSNLLEDNIETRSQKQGEDENLGTPDNEDGRQLGSSTASAVSPPQARLFSSDKELFKNKHTTAQISPLLQEGPCRPKQEYMPQRKWPIADGNRHFSDYFYYTINELMEKVDTPVAYSFRGNYAYCHICWLFGFNEVAQWTDWKHLSTTITRHLQSKIHRNSLSAKVAFCRKTNIEHVFDKELCRREKAWYTVMSVNYKILATISSNGLPLRESRCSEGVFKSLVELVAEFNPEYKYQVEHGTSYQSKTVYEEMLKFMAEEGRRFVLNEIATSKFYSVLADSTTDVSQNDQLSIVIRYVVIDQGNNTVTVQERFLGFYQLHDFTAQGYLKTLTGALYQQLGLNPLDCRGQSYDTTNTMSGTNGGLQKLFRDFLAEEGANNGKVYCPYTPCTAHTSDLSVGEASEKDASRFTMTFFGVSEKIISFFRNSNVRMLLLRDLKQKQFEELKSKNNSDFGLADNGDEEDDSSENDEDNACKSDYEPQPSTSSTSKEKNNLARSSSKPVLKFSKTRWDIKRPINRLMKCLNPIIAALQELLSRRRNVDEVTQAQGLLKAIDFEYCFQLILWDEILTYTGILNKTLQSRKLDLNLALSQFKITINNLRSMKNNFDSKYRKAKRFVQSLDDYENNTDFTEKRLRRRSRLADDAPDANLHVPTTKEEFFNEAFVKPLQVLANSLDVRRNRLQEQFKQFGLLKPSALSEAGDEIFRSWSKELSDLIPDLKDHEALAAELTNFCSLYFDVIPKENALKSSASDYLEFLLKHQLRSVYPNLEILFRIYLTQPVGTATNERTFNFLRNIKTYNRSTMADARLSDLAFLCIEREIVSKTIDIPTLSRKFAAAKARRFHV